MTNEETQELEAKRDGAHRAVAEVDGQIAEVLERKRIAEQDGDRKAFDACLADSQWHGSQKKLREAEFQRVCAEVDANLAEARREELADLAALCAPGSFLHEVEAQAEALLPFYIGLQRGLQTSPRSQRTRRPLALA